jgi:hypothetical protein
VMVPRGVNVGNDQWRRDQDHNDAQEPCVSLADAHKGRLDTEQ